MARKKASKTQPTSPQQRKRNGNGHQGSAQPGSPVAVTGIQGGPQPVMAPQPGIPQAQGPVPVGPIGTTQDAESARLNTLAAQVQDIRSGMAQLVDTVKNLVHQPRYQETVAPPHQQVAGIAPTQPVPMQPAGVIQSPTQMVQQQLPIPVEGGQPDEAEQQPAVGARSEGGRQARFDTCAACGQRIKLGTVDLKTGEYVASGLTTKWLRAQTGILVRLAEDGFTKVYQVNGNWLADTLVKRQMGERAISVPGYLCGESSSTHPTVKLVSAVMRRATDDEERRQYAARVLTESNRLREQGLI
jgi:hypothetical protein